MPVNATHPDYDTTAPTWARARDVLSGEDAVKAGGEKYLARLDSQTEEEFAAYVKRASYFNATARTSEAYLGLIFRRPPFLKLPEVRGQRSEVRGRRTGLGQAMEEFANDTDLLGTSLTGYAKMVVGDVVGVGRAGTLVDWEDEAEQRAYVAFYRAEQIGNWRVERVRGRNVLTMVVLREKGQRSEAGGQRSESGDEFEADVVEQIRVLRLVKGDNGEAFCRVDLWQPKVIERSWLGFGRQRGKTEWVMVDSRVPRRLGKPLPLIPFVFHGPRHSRPDVDRGPLEDIIAVNLDHYRLDADFKHGVHFTALPTAWVSGFDKGASLRIGSSTAWVGEAPGATAGFLEFTGQGLTTFERAMDRDERLMAVLGSRMLEDVKKVGETATAIELRQSGEYSILGGVAFSVSESLTQVLRWVYWWNSTEELPEDVTEEQVLMQLNTDFSTKGLASQDVQAIVAAWQAGAISQDTMHELFRRGEVLPEGRTNEEEAELIGESRKQKAESGNLNGMDRANGQGQQSVTSNQ
jgi:hypothetical protein